MGGARKSRARRAPGAPADLVQKIVHNLPLGVYVVDRGYTIVAWNKTQGAGPLSLPGQNVIGQKVSDVLTFFPR